MFVMNGVEVIFLYNANGQEPQQVRPSLRSQWGSFRIDLAKIVDRLKNDWKDDPFSQPIFRWTANLLAVDITQLNQIPEVQFEEEALSYINELRQKILVDQLERIPVQDPILVDGLVWEKRKFKEFKALLNSEISPFTGHPFVEKTHDPAMIISQLIQRLKIPQAPQALVLNNQVALIPRPANQELVPRQNQQLGMAHRIYNQAIQLSLIEIDHTLNPAIAKAKLQMYVSLIQGAYMRKELDEATEEMKFGNQCVELLMAEFQAMNEQVRHEEIQRIEADQQELQRNLALTNQLRQQERAIDRAEIRNQGQQIEQLQQQNQRLQNRCDEQDRKYIDLLQRFEQKAREAYNLANQPHKKKKKFFGLF